MVCEWGRLCVGRLKGAGGSGRTEHCQRLLVCHYRLV